MGPWETEFETQGGAGFQGIEAAAEALSLEKAQAYLAYFWLNV